MLLEIDEAVAEAVAGSSFKKITRLGLNGESN